MILTGNNDLCNGTVAQLEHIAVLLRRCEDALCAIALLQALFLNL